MMLAKLTNSKVLIAVVLIEAVLCVVLLVGGLSKANQLTKQSDEMKKMEDSLGFLAKQYEEIQKTTVPTEDYNRLSGAIQSLGTAAVSAGLIASSELPSRPELICSAVKALLQKPRAAAPVAGASAAAEVDFHISVVDAEIARQGNIDTKQTAKYALCIYHMQKVLDAVGYGLTATETTTNQAVMKFQTDNQLKADGKIGAKTWGKVKDLWKSKKPAA